jgi:hypothetical protein
MPDKIVIERPPQHVKVKVNPISNDLKLKMKLAVIEIVDRIKAKHL